MQQLLSSDLILVGFALLLGGLIGVFWERARTERRSGPAANDSRPADKD